ncbi:F-box/kelch-repeat protein At3g06240-like [Silene latifolia]|uniref:F-box/kelch-repeat protein At3g06240-like n=1 Tax=Silene latifolia TaxID=37657 RepID=UPI003D76D464
MFPEEIMIEILIRLPTKCIGRFRLVSKPWRHLLSGLPFIKAHLQQTKKLMDDNALLMLVYRHCNTLYSATLFHHLDYENIALVRELIFDVTPYFWPEGMPSCDGLILINPANYGRMLINPTTKETRELCESPYALDSFCSFTMYGLGYDHVSDDYKVVTISYYRHDHDEYCRHTSDEMFVNIYSVRNGTWKEDEGSAYNLYDGYVTTGVFVGGYIHWIVSRNSDNSTTMIGFNLAQEKFEEVAVPSSVDGDRFVFDRLVLLGGCLSMFHYRSENQTDIWVMKKYGVKQSWTKISIVDHWWSRFVPLLYMPEKREMMMVTTSNENLAIYNLDTATYGGSSLYGVIDGFLMHGKLSDFHIVGSFVETLVSPYYNCTRLAIGKCYRTRPSNFWNL